MRASKRKEMETGLRCYVIKGLKAYLAGLAALAVLLSIFAFIMTMTDVAPGMAVVLSYLGVAAATVLFGFLLGRMIGHHAMLIGGAVFLVMYLTVTILYFIMNGFGLSDFNYFVLIILAAASLLGSIAGVSTV